MRVFFCLCLFMLLLLSLGCGGRRSTDVSKPSRRGERIDVDRDGNIKLRGEKPVSLKRKRPGDLLQRGIASWYGHPYHGRKTANGERYDMWDLTAAHKTLPFNTVVTVVNKDNGRKVKVRINDRGPFIRGRIIDLSRKAAEKIGVYETGIAKVALYLKDAPEERRTAGRRKPKPDIYETEDEPRVPTVTVSPPEGGWWTIQVGSFREKARAEAMVLRMQRLSPHVTMEPAEGFWRVRVGRFSKKVDSFDLAERLSDEGIKPWILFAEE
ncbi:MAG: septal ring lytic transglycosylase RlpA family protein [Acidobacteriota bacterium]|nr:septal ring lytic transglycosylase RlpA family protein [Acidobacteriota bacterium]